MFWNNVCLTLHVQALEEIQTQCPGRHLKGNQSKTKMPSKHNNRRKIRIWMKTPHGEAAVQEFG